MVACRMSVLQLKPSESASLPMTKTVGTVSAPPSTVCPVAPQVDVSVIPLPLPLSDASLSNASLSNASVTHAQTCVRLDWEDLQCFEVVRRQFEQLGVIFTNAVALRPSNSAYPAYSGTMVVMGAPKDGWLEATFLQPVRFVSGFVTSSRRAVMTAFDSCNRPIAQVEHPDNLADRGSAAPNTCLSVAGTDIRRVTFQVFNGHLTLDDFCFGS